MGIDGERCRKMQKDGKRYEKIGKDSGCIGEYFFHVMFLGFVFCSVLVGGSVYAVIT